MASLIDSENTWVLWALLTIIAAAGITLEQKTRWAARMSAGGLCMLFGIFLTTVRITPATSGTYAAVNNYILPLSIPLLLFRCDLKKILKESGRLFVIFHAACLGCMIATVLVGFLFRSQENIRGIVAMMTAACTGRPVNLMAMSRVYQVQDSMISASIVGIIIVITLELVILSVLSKTKFVHKHFAHPHMDQLQERFRDDAGSIASQYWKPKTISLRSLGQSIAITFAICAVSTRIADGVSSSNAASIVKQVFGTLFLATRIFKKWDWESFCNAACASIGGPTTACVISVSNEWKDLILPGILVGLWGYVVGNYMGILCAQLF